MQNKARRARLAEAIYGPACGYWPSNRDEHEWIFLAFMLAVRSITAVQFLPPDKKHNSLLD